MSDLDLPAKLRERATHPPEWTTTDHGHTDCWLMALAADRIEELEADLARTLQTLSEVDRRGTTRWK